MITKKPKNDEKGWLHKFLPMSKVTGEEKNGDSTGNRASKMKRWRHEKPSKPLPSFKIVPVTTDNDDKEKEDDSH